jgi:uncharacterized protein with ATP-grasp and redox domains
MEATVADLMTNLAAVVTDIRRIDPDNNDPYRHAKRAAKRHAVTILEHAVAQAYMALDLAERFEDASRAAATIPTEGA